jgi:hypothetical protein
MDLQGADRINDELEVGYDARFERSWTHAEWVGRGLMLLFATAGLAGLLGRGPLSHRTVSPPGGSLTVDFEPIARSQTPTQVTFHLHNDGGSDPAMHLFISTNVIEPMGLHTIDPQPLESRVVDGGLLLTFLVPPGTKDAIVRMTLDPTELGDNQLSVKLGDAATVRWNQVVVP